VTSELDLIRSLGVCAVARALGITSQSVSQWKRVPADHCAAIAAAFPRRATRARLRPDLFGGKRKAANGAEGEGTQ
jgi:DNA-binding transcriptional regulator YdaS (Cro superfamily)